VRAETATLSEGHHTLKIEYFQDGGKGSRVRAQPVDARGAEIL